MLISHSFEAQWPSDEATRTSILADFAEPWGDRRQEIVFIGEKLDVEGLTAEFDRCLLTDREMKKWEKTMKSSDDMMVVNDRLANIFEGRSTLFADQISLGSLEKTDWSD
jgi:hypothetical protein